MFISPAAPPLMAVVCLPAEEHSEIPARKPAGLRPTTAGCGSQTDALHRPVHAAPAARVQHQGVFKV